MPEFGKEEFVIYSEPVLIVEVTPPICGDQGIKYESVGDQGTGTILDVCCGDSGGCWY